MNNNALLTNLNFKTKLTLGEILTHGILWFILGIFTLGFAFFVYAYYQNMKVLNATEILDANGTAIGRFKCELEFTDIIGHAILWWFFSIITLGIASFVFLYRKKQFVLERTVLQRY